MKVAIVTIGDEILIGQIVDTNSSWMAQKMTLSGFEIVEKISIGDDSTQIKNTIDNLFRRVDVILTTGGLGPTKDDITKNTLSEYFGVRMIFNDSVLQNINRIITNPTALNELTSSQAYVPENCTVIQNRVGTAPVMWFDHQGKVLISMPGVPYEMRYAMENEIIPRLQERFQTETYLSKVFLVSGYAESALSIYLTDFENNLPRGFGLAYLPASRIIRLRLFVKGNERQDELDCQSRLLESLLNKAILADRDISLEKLLGERLFAKGYTLSTAESCTGGNIAHLITSVPGSSNYFKGSVIAYANQIKENVLSVPKADIEQYGAVSQEVVTSMTRGLQALTGADCIIAVSGIAGPEGGTEDKPVGTVWIATAIGSEITTRKYQLGKYREANINGASNLAIIQLLEMIKD